MLAGFLLYQNFAFANLSDLFPVLVFLEVQLRDLSIRNARFQDKDI